MKFDYQHVYPAIRFFMLNKRLDKHNNLVSRSIIHRWISYVEPIIKKVISVFVVTLLSGGCAPDIGNKKWRAAMIKKL